MYRDKIIKEGYLNAGDDFLALKLRKIFSIIETEEDKALHNDMLRDIQSMVEPESFFKIIACVLNSGCKGMKNFIKRAANIIIDLAAKEGIQNGKEN